jgi:hypothetical protein
MMADTDDGQDWQAVSARALAYLALHQAGLREKDLATQGQFLARPIHEVDGDRFAAA